MCLVIVQKFLKIELTQVCLYKNIILELIVLKVILKKTLIKKFQYRNKNLLDHKSIREACTRNYVHNLYNNPSILKPFHT